MASPNTLETTLNELSIHPSPSKSSSSFAKKQSTKKSTPLADSWEDEDASDSGEETDRPLSHQISTDYPSAPPPTPISPTTTQDFSSPYGYTEEGSRSGSGSGRKSDVRPEKTDKVASRMISAALGVRAPKRTEEQNAFDRAARDKEIKRKKEEKERAAREAEEAERARKSVWED